MVMKLKMGKKVFHLNVHLNIGWLWKFQTKGLYRRRTDFAKVEGKILNSNRSAMFRWFCSVPDECPDLCILLVWDISISFWV